MLERYNLLFRILSIMEAVFVVILATKYINIAILMLSILIVELFIKDIKNIYLGIFVSNIPLLFLLKDSDLKNAVIGVEKGTIFEDLAKKWKENNLIKDVLSFDSTTDLFNAISSGKIDAGLADSIIINYYIKEKDPLLRQLKGYTPELQGVMGIAVKKDDVFLLNALNKAINDMKVDGALYSILVKNGLDKNNMISN